MLTTLAQSTALNSRTWCSSWGSKWAERPWQKLTTLFRYQSTVEKWVRTKYNVMFTFPNKNPTICFPQVSFNRHQESRRREKFHCGLYFDGDALNLTYMPIIILLLEYLQQLQCLLTFDLNQLVQSLPNIGYFAFVSPFCIHILKWFIADPRSQPTIDPRPHKHTPDIQFIFCNWRFVWLWILVGQWVWSQTWYKASDAFKAFREAKVWIHSPHPRHV